MLHYIYVILTEPATKRDISNCSNPPKTSPSDLSADTGVVRTVVAGEENTLTRNSNNNK